MNRPDPALNAAAGCQMFGKYLLLDPINKV